ncbi:TIGR04255 family protein [Methyloversatilis sp. XJ19-49]|uniref:TIGR04255 family protein n=1 Tax=Methyloversatilis sp. XJ19-49 TaxID=2963429 RepID=UPI00211BADDB|nr:TIGR04255 family protein [Methyloversatilis sp. XJ19-49]MCQ9378831.1 TIGR04255 family protein [Methyloversatilis sp. XJ19-49]
MSASWNADHLVTVQSNNLDRYKKNFLQQAVCELRFPTLMELGESRPPSVLVNALRKEYPHLELANEFTIGPGASSTGANNSHIFRSAKLNWTISIKESALSIETSSYSGFPTMRSKILQAVEAAKEVIDTDFFTRIGLRYINIIESGDEPVTSWINPALVQTLLNGPFKSVSEYAGRLHLSADDGGCLLQHGIRYKQNANKSSPILPDYTIDIDAYRNTVSIADTESAIDKLHEQAFALFDWALAEPARKFLTS